MSNNPMTETSQRGITRRKFLRYLGIGGVGVGVVVIGGVGYRAIDQGVFEIGQGPAYAPWSNWRNADMERPMALVRSGILAANAHNTQPWLFEIDDARIDLYADTSRNTGAMDPFLREMYIGLGCCLENVSLAGQAEGYKPDITYMPTLEDETHVARVDLGDATPQVMDMYEAIPNRHTNRGPYDVEQTVSQDTLNQLSNLGTEFENVRVFWFTQDPEYAMFGEMIVGATEAIIADEEQAHDTFVWQRQTWEEVEEHRDGITLEAAGLPQGTLILAKLLPPQSESQSHASWLDTTENTQVATAPVFGMVAIRDIDSRSQQLHAGRLWQRMHLWATTQDLAMHPMNQPIERAAREEQLNVADRTYTRILADLVDNPEWSPVMTFRLGYPAREVNPAPRRDPQSVMT